MTFFALPLVVAASALLPEARSFWTVVEDSQLQPVQHQVTARLVGVGESLAVYQEEGYHFSAAGEDDERGQVSAAVRTFDEAIFPREVALFGPCPDRDGNGKVILLLTRMARSPALFFPFDEMDEKEALRCGFHSNQGEVLYQTFDEQGNRAGWNVQELAESFHHLLHWARDPGETSWRSLLANYTPYLCGVAPVRLLWGDFDREGRLHSPSDAWGERGWSLLFIQYLREKLGDRGLRELVASPEQGLAGVAQILAPTGRAVALDGLLGDFAMACWLDDPTIGGGRFSFSDVAPPRPQPVATVVASRPSSGAVEVGVGGMAFFLIEGTGERSFPLTLQGEASGKWVARAVLLRGRGPDQELPITFSNGGVARLDIPQLPPSDQVVVAVMALPALAPGFDRRKLLLRWGLAWVPRAPQNLTRDLLGNLLKKALPDGGAAARARLLTTLDRLSGKAPTDATGPVVETRYAWAPQSRAVVEVLHQEAARRDLHVREQTFLRHAPNEIEQEWTNVLVDVPGSDARRWPVVLAAHWDGARGTLQDSYLRALNLNDNASGVAVALEAAAAMTRMPHRAPILVAFLAGGYHDAAGAHALFDQLHESVTAWVELDSVGRADAWPRAAEVYLEKDPKSPPLPFVVTHSFKRVGLVPRPEEGFTAPHCGASLVSASRTPALVVSTHSGAWLADDLDTPLEVERDGMSPDLMVLLTKAIAQAVVELAGAL